MVLGYGILFGLPLAQEGVMEKHQEKIKRAQSLVMKVEVKGQKKGKKRVEPRVRRRSSKTLDPA
jgi:hypothetical protein